MGTIQPKSFGTVLPILVICAAARSADPEVPIPNELPRSWSADEIAKVTPPYGAGGRVYVLAWQTVEDDRPLRVESCLVMRVLKDESDQGKWCLAHLYRHPAEAKPEWHLSMIHMSGKRGEKADPGRDIFHFKRFKERPGNKEVYASLTGEEVGWSFELENGWKFVGCGVCEKNWRMAVGEKPARFFGKEVSTGYAVLLQKA